MFCYDSRTFQLTTSHGGRRKFIKAVATGTGLSTHDLTRRSTIQAYLDSQKNSFQLTTSHGGRQSRRHPLSTWKIFQLTTSHGGRLNIGELLLLFPHLSTHDLTRRSTIPSCTGIPTSSSFNSRPHTEVDSHPLSALLSASFFQLTTSHGGRL